MRTKILFEDEAILVIHKPAGLATQTDKPGMADVVSELKNYLAKSGKNPYLGLVHRLDQPVEGILVFAKTPEAAKNLSAQLTTGKLKKYYYCLVPGKPDAGKGKLTDYLVKSDANTSKVVPPELLKGPLGNIAKEARLEWYLVITQNMGFDPDDAKSIGTDSYSMLEIQLFTGRHHQIRVQMAHAGMPLLGDLKYGSPESKKLSEKFGVKTTALIAYRVEFRHPVTGALMHYNIPAPEEWSYGF